MMNQDKKIFNVNDPKRILKIIKKLKTLDPGAVKKNFDIELENLLEWFKCKASFRYFCYKYVKIPEPGSDIPLKTNEAQEIFIDEFFHKKFVVINKSRQIGLSTILQALSVWATLFFKNVTVGVISRDRAEATEFVKKAKNIIDKLPQWMVPPKSVDREQRVVFEITDLGGTGSLIISGWVNASNPGSVFRGPSISILIIDEAAFIRKIDEAFMGMMASTSRAQKIAKEKGIPYGTIIVSTPNKTDGIGRWFYHQYLSGMTPTSNYVSLFLHWTLIKQYREDPEWYKNECKKYVKENTGEIDFEKVDQEYNGVFLSGSGNDFFDPDIKRLMNFFKYNIIERINNFMDTNGILEIYKKFEEDKLYIISYDTANLSGNSFSTIQVVDFETLEQVAEYQGKVRIIDFPNVIKKVIEMYPNYLLIGEYNTINESVGDTLYKDHEIRKHMYREKVFRKNKNGNRVLSKVLNGVMTTGSSKPIMMDDIKLFIENYPHLIYSQRLKMEIAGAEKKNGKLVSKTTTDLIMSYAFAVFLKYEGYYREIPYFEDWKFRELENRHNKVKKVIDAAALYDDSIDGISYEDKVSILSNSNLNLMNHLILN